MNIKVETDPEWASSMTPYVIYIDGRKIGGRYNAELLIESVARIIDNAIYFKEI